ncbi:hypothetical protein HELRODRAFT_192597, partial [Helobdella robusta]|uniref:Autophagy-related protein 2 n=1 Tax=Helobdella robusta TaxID=6412 RepID=T1FU42_HELRO
MWWPNIRNFDPSILTDVVKRKLCEYILKRIGCDFLKEKTINMDQLTVEMYNGRASLSNLELDVVLYASNNSAFNKSLQRSDRCLIVLDASSPWSIMFAVSGALLQARQMMKNINDILTKNGLPIEVVECYVGCISVSIPWRSIFSESSIVEVENVEVTIRHAGRVESEHNLIDSMLFTSMSTSMKLAEECLKKDTASGNKLNQNNPFEGVQDLACTVETIFSKVKANMKNTTIYYEHTDEERNIMVTLELRIDRIEYKDESGNGERSDASSNENYNSSNEPLSGTGSSGKGNNKSGNGFHSTPAEEKDDVSKKRNMSSKSDGNSSTKTKSGHMTLIRIKNFILTGIRLYYCETPIVKQLERSTHEDWSKHKNDYSSSLIMMMAGTQEFKVQFIQDSSKFGPEIQVESRLGNLHLVLCPGILSTITNILDKINETPKRQKRSGPQSMKIVAEEYEKISKGWEKPIVRNVGGLGKQTFEQSDEEEFKSLCFTSFSSKSKWNNTDDDDSSEYLSNSGFFSMKNSCASSASDDQQQTGNEVFASTSINVELNLLSVVILHENPGHAQQQATTKTHRTSTFDIDCLHSFSDGYFHAVSGLSLKNMNDVVDIMKVRQEFSKIVAQDHLCLLCSVGEFKTSRQNIEKSFTISVSFGAFDFVEAIFGRPDVIDEAPGHANEVFNLNFFNLPDYTELLVFERSSKAPMTRVPKRGISKVDPVVSIKMEVVHRKKYHSVSKVKQSSIMMTVKLSECHSEVDVTILDRLRSLTTSLSASNKQTPRKNSNVPMDQSVSGMLLSCDDLSFMQGNQASIDVAASLWSLKLRFPKLDLTFCDKNKRKAMGSERRLHEEYLLIDLVEPKLKAASSSEQVFVDLVTMTGIASLVQNNTKHTLLKISSDSTLEEQREGFNLPRRIKETVSRLESTNTRFEVRRTNFAANSTLLVESDNKVLDSRLLGSMGPSYYCGVQDVDQAPFSSVKHYFDTEELVYSGDRKDMLYFKDVVSDKTKLLVDINVPLVQIFINTKNTLELLYNRFLSDLALWQPEPESPTSSPVVLHDSCTNNWATYSLINPYNTTYDFSGDQFNNTDSSSESEGERNEGFKRPTKINDETILCLSVAFKKAQLVAYCADARPASPAAPSTTSSTQTSNLKQVGKVYIDLDDTHIVFVYGYHGDPEIQYLCLQVCNAQLYHNGLLPVKSNKLSTFEDEFSPTNISHNLHKILYPSNNGIKDKGSNDMLSATIKMTYETFQQVMHYKVAVTVRCCTVKHHEGTVENYWANQLADLFTLVDYDIPGYELPKSSTELNFQLLDCSLDYQPTNLPYHAILYCQMFAICSSIVVETKGSVTKFIVEDTCLFLSKRINEEVINLEKNYVCVLDL